MIAERELKTIAVLGATGRQGSATIAALLAKGFKVIGIVRDEKKKATIEAKGAKADVANLDDVKSLSQAFEGADGLYVYFALSFNVNYLLKQFQNIKNAAKERNIKYIIYSNGFIIRPGSGLSAFDTVIAAEDDLFANFSACILKPTAFIDDMLPTPINDSFKITATVFATCYDENAKFPYISTRDIGMVAANVFENPSAYRSKRIYLASENLTGAETLAIVSKIRNTEFTYKKLPFPLLARIFAPKLVEFISTIDETVVAEALNNMHTINPEYMTMEQYLISKDFKNVELKPDSTWNSCVIS